MNKPANEIQIHSPCGAATNLIPVASGRSQVIEGHTANEYRLATPCGDQLLWLAPEYPDWQKLIREMSTLTKVQPDFPLNTALSSGMVVRVETLHTNSAHGRVATNQSPQNATSVLTLLSARIEPADPAAMRLPANYREVKDFGPPEVAPTNKLALRMLKEHEAQVRALSSTNPPFQSLSDRLPYEETPWSHPHQDTTTALPNVARTLGPQSPSDTNTVRFAVSSWSPRGPSTKIVASNENWFRGQGERLRSLTATNRNSALGHSTLRTGELAKPLINWTNR